MEVSVRFTYQAHTASRCKTPPPEPLSIAGPNRDSQGLNIIDFIDFIELIIYYCNNLCIFLEAKMPLKPPASCGLIAILSPMFDPAGVNGRFNW